MPASPAFACVLRAAERQTVGACDQSPRCAGHAGRSYVPAIAGAGRGRRIVGVGCPSSACVVRAASPSPVGRCSRHSSSAADGGRAGDASADYLGSIPVRSPSVLPASNTCNAHWGQWSTDPCLGTLDWHRDTALFRPAKREQCRACDSWARNCKFC